MRLGEQGALGALGVLSSDSGDASFRCEEGLKSTQFRFPRTNGT